LVLTKLTGWGLNEILDLDVDDLLLWIKDAQKIEQEIANSAKKQEALIHGQGRAANASN
jgi:hypothetical protein